MGPASLQSNTSRTMAPPIATHAIDSPHMKPTSTATTVSCSCACGKMRVRIYLLIPLFELGSRLKSDQKKKGMRSREPEEVRNEKGEFVNIAHAMDSPHLNPTSIPPPHHSKPFVCVRAHVNVCVLVSFVPLLCSVLRKEASQRKRELASIPSQKWRGRNNIQAHSWKKDKKCSSPQVVRWRNSPHAKTPHTYPDTHGPDPMPPQRPVPQRRYHCKG